MLSIVVDKVKIIAFNIRKFVANGPFNTNVSKNCTSMNI